MKTFTLNTESLELKLYASKAAAERAFNELTDVIVTAPADIEGLGGAKLLEIFKSLNRGEGPSKFENSRKGAERTFKAMEDFGLDAITDEAVEKAETAPKSKKARKRAERTTSGPAKSAIVAAALIEGRTTATAEKRLKEAFPGITDKRARTCVMFYQRKLIKAGMLAEPEKEAA